MSPDEAKGRNRKVATLPYVGYDGKMDNLADRKDGHFCLVAQSVEHMTVNHRVAGSRPAEAAKYQ